LALDFTACTKRLVVTWGGEVRQTEGSCWHSIRGRPRFISRTYHFWSSLGHTKQRQPYCPI